MALDPAWLGREVHDPPPSGWGRRWSGKENSELELYLINSGCWHLIERGLDGHVLDIFNYYYYFNIWDLILIDTLESSRQGGEAAPSLWTLLLLLIWFHGSSNCPPLSPEFPKQILPLSQGDKSDTGHKINTNFMEAEPDLKQRNSKRFFPLCIKEHLKYIK